MPIRRYKRRPRPGLRNWSASLLKSFARRSWLVKRRNAKSVSSRLRVWMRRSVKLTRLSKKRPRKHVSTL